MKICQTLPRTNSMRANVSLLVLFVPDGDISPSLQQQLTDAWVTHLGCQHQRCPAILEENQRRTDKYRKAHPSTKSHSSNTIQSIKSSPKNQFVARRTVKKRPRVIPNTACSLKWTKLRFSEYLFVLLKLTVHALTVTDKKTAFMEQAD